MSTPAPFHAATSPASHSSLRGRGITANRPPVAARIQ
jgi:hypothetical protein